MEHVSVFKYLGIHLDSRLGFQSQFKLFKLKRLTNSFKVLMLKRIRPFINENTALIITKLMLLPYFDMGNMYFTSLTVIKDIDKLNKQPLEFYIGSSSIQMSIKLICIQKQICFLWIIRENISC